MRLTLGRAALAAVILGVAGFVLATATSAPHGQPDPGIANLGYLVFFAAVPITVLLLLAMGVRAGRKRSGARQ